MKECIKIYNSQLSWASYESFCICSVETYKSWAERGMFGFDAFL